MTADADHAADGGHRLEDARRNNAETGNGCHVHGSARRNRTMSTGPESRAILKDC